MATGTNDLPEGFIYAGFERTNVTQLVSANAIESDSGINKARVTFGNRDLGGPGIPPQGLSIGTGGPFAVFWNVKEWQFKLTAGVGAVSKTVDLTVPAGSLYSYEEDATTGGAGVVTDAFDPVTPIDRLTHLFRSTPRGGESATQCNYAFDDDDMLVRWEAKVPHRVCEHHEIDSGVYGWKIAVQGFARVMEKGTSTDARQTIGTNGAPGSRLTTGWIVCDEGSGALSGSPEGVWGTNNGTAFNSGFSATIQPLTWWD